MADRNVLQMEQNTGPKRDEYFFFSGNALESFLTSFGYRDRRAPRSRDGKTFRTEH